MAKALPNITECLASNLACYLAQAGCAPPDRILRLLMATGAEFAADLNQRVDLQSYSEKLSRQAHTIFAVGPQGDIGLAAVYLNAYDTRIGFITHVGVLPSERGKGVGFELMAQVKRLARQLNFETLQLEAGIDNAPAILLYKKSGFIIAEFCTGPRVKLTLTMSPI